MKCFIFKYGNGSIDLGWLVRLDIKSCQLGKYFACVFYDGGMGHHQHVVLCY